MNYCLFLYVARENTQSTSVNPRSATLVFLKQKHRFISSLLQHTHAAFHCVIAAMVTPRWCLHHIHMADPWAPIIHVVVQVLSVFSQNKVQTESINFRGLPGVWCTSFKSGSEASRWETGRNGCKVIPSDKSSNRYFPQTASDCYYLFQKLAEWIV